MARDLEDRLGRALRQGDAADARKLLACPCRPAKRANGCAYCGSVYGGEFICGRCSAAGIDGKVIRGTSAVTCAKHRKGSR